MRGPVGDAAVLCMNADEFVEALRRLAPTPEEAARRALLPEEVTELARRFACPERAGRRARANVLEDLLNRYHVGSLAIGRVEFVSDPRPHWAGMMVGTFEANPLVTLANGEVAVFEQARFGERVMDVARDGGRFLALLAHFAHGLRTRASWLSDLDEAARMCAELAGGSAYEPFCLALCSVAEYGA